MSANKTETKVQSMHCILLKRETEVTDTICNLFVTRITRALLNMYTFAIRVSRYSSRDSIRIVFKICIVYLYLERSRVSHPRRLYDSARN